MNHLLNFRDRLQKAPTKEGLEELTLELAEVFKDRYEPIHVLAEKGNVDVLQRLDFLLGEVSGKVLDIGCFDGFYSIEIAKRGYPVVGLDMLQLCVDYATNRLNGKPIELEFFKGFAEDIPFCDGEFNTVILSHTLEHVFDDKKALDEAVRVTRPKGKIIVVLPTELGNDPTHLRCIPSLEIKERLSVHGAVSEEKSVGNGIGYICTLK
jgi:ubiquinone/menaquinone biosynthesis C-methylase UbiE